MSADIIRELAALDVLNTAELKARWRQLCQSDPPAGNRAYLVRRLSWAIQNARYGGNADGVRARLEGVLAAAGCNAKTGSRQQPDPGRPRLRERPANGTRWTRYYNGEWHELTFVTNGVSYRGTLFSSPTAVVHAITGSHRSGPDWFLNVTAKEKRGGSKHDR